MFNFRHCPISRGGGCCPASWLPQIQFEVAGLNELLYKELEALAVIGFMAMVPVIVAS